MTLILSASDFTMVDSSGTNLALSGTARLHADIDSAAKGYDSGSLPSSSYCREYNTDEKVGTYAVTLISGSVEGGAYSGSLGDNAVSVRAWLRTFNSTPYIYLFVKNQSEELFLDNSYSVQLRNATLDLYGGNGFLGVSVSGITTNEWHRVRMDYIPIAGMKDVINLYTSSAGGTNTETWELVGSAEILNTSPHYITASDSSLTIGYGMKSYSDPEPLWIDDFDVYVTPAG